QAGDGFGRLGGAGLQLLDTQGQAVPARVFGRVQQGRYLSLLAGEALIELGLSLVEGGQLADQVIQLALKLCLGGSQGIEFTLEGWQPGSVQLLSLQCIQALLVMEKSAADHQPSACAQQGCCPVSGFHECSPGVVCDGWRRGSSSPRGRKHTWRSRSSTVSCQAGPPSSCSACFRGRGPSW